MVDEIKKDDYVLLLSKKASYLVRMNEKFNCSYGQIDLSKIKRFGQKVKTNKGVEFTVIKPTVVDVMERAKRVPQVVLPKDACSIVGMTGVSSGWKVVDAGAGSGFLAIFLGNLVKPDGLVISYEIKKSHAKIAQRNVKTAGLDKVVKIKHADVTNIKEKNLDLITLDMKGAENFVMKAYKALKPGGWLVVYSPHIEQVKKVKTKVEKHGFVSITTIENIRREWKVDTHTHPFPSGIMHTGFLTFARKV